MNKKEIIDLFACLIFGVFFGLKTTKYPLGIIPALVSCGIYWELAKKDKRIMGYIVALIIGGFIVGVINTLCA